MTLRSRTRLRKAVLVVGLFAITAGVLVAHFSPATGYELSIYRATPTAFWVALRISFLVSMIVGFTGQGRIRSTALGLGSVSTVLLMSLPLVRGYYFFGKEDALTHLGYVRDILQGRLDLANMIYPAMHTLSATLHALTGRDPAETLLFTVAVFVISFVVFVPLCVRAITNRRRVDPIAVLTPALCLPVVVLYLPVLQPVSTSEAALFVPVAAFVLLGYLNRRRTLTFGGLLLFIVVFLVILHPQQALVFVGLFVVALLVHPLARVVFGDADGISSVVPGLLQFVAVAVPGLAVLAWWLSTHPPTAQFSSLEARLFGVGTTDQLKTFLTTHGLGEIIGTMLDDAKPFAAPRNRLLTSLGVSTETLYRRVFPVRLLYGVFAVGALFVPVLSRVTARRTDGNRRIRYPVVVALVCGLLPAAGIIVLYFLAGLPNQYFRYAGFVFVFVTILGAVFLREAHTALSSVLPKNTVHGLFVVVLVVSLVLSTPVVYRSPHIYQPTEEVSRGQVAGYEAAFGNTVADVPFAGIDSTTYRYRDAIYGSEVSRTGIGMPPQSTLDSSFDNPRSGGKYSRVPSHFADRSLPSQIDSPVYLTVTASDRKSSTRLYGGTNFSRADFAWLESAPGIAKVVSTGEFALYLVTPTNATSQQRIHEPARHLHHPDPFAVGAETVTQRWAVR